MGRKGLYSEWLEAEKLTILEGWARDGLSDKQISKNIGISTVTFYDWVKKYPDFSNAIKKGKEVVDFEVENALLKRALGYTVKESSIEIDDTGKKKRKITEKEIAPDVTAQIFWLKNRKPERWRDRRNVELSGELENPFAGLSTEELKKMAEDG